MKPDLIHEDFKQRLTLCSNTRKVLWLTVNIWTDKGSRMSKIIVSTYCTSFLILINIRHWTFFILSIVSSGSGDKPYYKNYLERKDFTIRKLTRKSRKCFAQSV